MEVRPVTAKTSRLYYTLVYDNSMLPDDAAREKDKASRVATFTRAIQNIKVLAEGGKLASIAGCQSTGNLGRGYNNNAYFPGAIAEVLVYRRALSETERQGLEAYLQAKYFGPASSQVATPTITPDGGSFSGPVTVTLQTATAGATIRYTLDGTAPGVGSPQYTSSFQPRIRS